MFALLHFPVLVVKDYILNSDSWYYVDGCKSMSYHYWAGFCVLVSFALSGPLVNVEAVGCLVGSVSAS